MKAAMLSTIVLFWFAISAGQEKQVLPQEQQVVLDNPEVIRLEISGITRRRSAGVYEKQLGPFEVHAKPKFALVVTNRSLIPLAVRTWDSLAQNRPRLLRDNQEVPYREGVDDLIKQKDTGIQDIISMVVVRLLPNRPKVLETLDLSYWYAPLELGHYQLSIEHRFVQGGKWVDSDPIVFEVEPKKNSKP